MSTYINKTLKKVSVEDLKKVLKEMADKHKADRLQLARDTNEALHNGFRCM